MNESTEPQIRKFNPGTLQSDEEIIRQFVVRNRELDTVLEVIRGNIDSQSCQHVLLVAPRGRGKSMLLARVAAELRNNEELPEALFPVRFMEESQEIFNAADFWLEALFHLARESAAHHPDLARELHSTHEALASKWHEESLADRARAAVLEAAGLLRKKLVLMVENMQALSESVDEDFGWQLRQALQTEPQIMLLATATSRFAALDDVSQPFFETFRIVCLEALTTQECRQLWQVVSGDDVTEREIRPLEILTGGNPRLLVIVGAFAQHRSLRQLMEELVQLIDEHTEYFRSHLEVLSKTERRVYLAVIDLWKPSSTGEVAKRARMDVRTVSTMLGRLVSRGAVVVEGSGKKRRYAAAERLYCIYYKLRRERGEAAIVQNLIQFMMAFYSAAEMIELFVNMLQESRESPIIEEWIQRAMQQLAHPPHKEFPSGLKELPSVLKEVEEARKGRDLEKGIEVLSRWASSPGMDSSPAKEIKTILALKASLLEAQRYHERRKYDAVIAASDKMVEHVDTINTPELRPLLQIVFAQALLIKGFAQQELNELEAALTTYDEVIKRSRSGKLPGIRSTLAAALVRKGEIQTKLGRIDEALHIFDEIPQILGDSNDRDSNLLRWWAQLEKSQALLIQEQHEAAMDAFRSVYAAFDPDNDEMKQAMLKRVPELVAAGASARDLADILASAPEKRGKLEPLAVALRQMAGETVRAPAEVLEVAADICKEIEEKRGPTPPE